MVQKNASLTKEEQHFIKTVWKHYKDHGRHTLPWRKTYDPYKVLVSEIMLQQTQVSRVLPKYRDFLRRFRTAKQLASAPLGEVLQAWQGLGYNRRAKFLWQAAHTVVTERNGVWPKTAADLCALPGIGEYTAGAVMNFAYNTPIPLIETNVRTVFIYHFFHNKDGVTDKELIPLIERMLDRKNPREWNWALMDYGSYLKETVGNLSRKSKTYQRQSDFRSSNRYVRGKILTAIAKKPLREKELFSTLPEIDPSRVIAACVALQQEGLLLKEKGWLRLP